MTYRQKLGEFWKIQEILYLMGTKIFYFWPLGAEKIEFKDLKPVFLHTEIMANCIAVLSTDFCIKIRLCFEELWHLQFKVIFKCRECFGILLSSAVQYTLKLCDYHKKWQWKLSLKRPTQLREILLDQKVILDPNPL